MFGLFVLGVLAYIVASSRSREEWREILNNIEE